eukprot:COSAG03_NODE_13717_length_491_cov_1.553571_2_plen_57_part_01
MSCRVLPTLWRAVPIWRIDGRCVRACLCVCLSVCVCVCLSVCLCVCVSVSLSLSVSV